MTSQYHNIRRFTAYLRPYDDTEDYEPNMDEAVYYEGVRFTDGTTVIQMNDGSGAISVYQSIEHAIQRQPHLSENVDVVFFDEPGELPWEVEDLELGDE